MLKVCFYVFMKHVLSVDGGGVEIDIWTVIMFLAIDLLVGSGSRSVSPDKLSE